jgi:prevent-host-death family protein
MRNVNLAIVKDGLSAYVEYVRRGGRVRILVHGKAVADIVPIEETTDELSSLESEGVVVRGTAKWSRALDRHGPRARRSAAATLVELRRSGR